MGNFTQQRKNDELGEIRLLVKEFVEGDNEKKADILLNQLESKFVRKLKDDKTSKHQIRKHYHRLLEIKEQIEASGAKDIKPFLPEIAMTSAYATYDRNRQGTKIGQLFEAFLKSLVKEVVERKDTQTFLDLMKLFEAVVGLSSKYLRN
ncbi:type III-A CRISPR-associated protein Csm2 [Desulfurobacterium atlanticum]|uniref:CRISPR system Cms protein Csm2 n=1 Tax=Desulfurobacterium atlanticum TaxID=240169 RepID=A0A238Y4S5_9BACT|nr:type III-A CRISPR-associated protein Csm2 [Desulfurobacterium atlanticum]SNR65818.1 CRISPR type III-A/MTUBE-associated protein Csm2 [Desulfurobacterium atlanticum]